MNPHTDGTKQILETPSEIIGIESMVVTQTQGHIQGDNVGHEVEVTPERYDSPIVAEVLVTQNGDTAIPEEGDRVLVAFRTDRQPVVIGTHYAADDSIPDFEPGERRFGHPKRDTFLRFKNDGNVLLENETESSLFVGDSGKIVLETDDDTRLELAANGAIHAETDDGTILELRENGAVKVETDDGAAIKLADSGGAAMVDEGGHGIEAQNNGEVHIYGKVKQHTSTTLNL